LPIFKTCQLNIPGKTLEADPAASSWAGNVAADNEITGLIILDGVLSAGPGELTLTFTQIYGSLDSPRSIAVHFSVD
jgi:hypothetical protein